MGVNRWSGGPWGKQTVQKIDILAPSTDLIDAERIRQFYNSRLGRISFLALFFITIAVFVLSPGSDPSSPDEAKPASSNQESSQKLESFHGLNVQRRQIQYGPYPVPARSEDEGMKRFVRRNIEKPCTNCVITSMQADLHYGDGTPANANTGLWLHHVVLANMAQRDLNCPQRRQRFFASGNERSKVDLWANGTVEAGYYVAEDASFMLSAEIMNMAAESSRGMITITYEYILSPPASFGHVQPLWLDIGGCERSTYLTAFPGAMFEYSSPKWFASTAGRITFMGGHLHDAGTRLEIQNNGEVMCECEAGYGESPEYVDMHMDTRTEHLSSLTSCINEGQITRGDRLSITAYYDPIMHKAMRNTDGILEDVMGIAMLYFVESPLS